MIQADGPVHVYRMVVNPGRSQVVQHEIEFRAAITETGLVNGITPVVERMIDGDGLCRAPLAVLDDQIAFEGLGLAAGVVFHPEILKQYDERQGLHQVAGAQVDEGGARGAAFGYGNAGAERGIVYRQLALVRYPADGQVPGFRLQLPAQGLDFQWNVTVQKSADTDDDHRAVRKQVTETVACSFHGRQGGAVVLPLNPVPETETFEAHRQFRNRLFMGKAGAHLGVMRQVEQLRFLHVFPVLFEGGEDPGSIAIKTDTGGRYQERQDQDEPATGIDIVQSKSFENAVPEWTEFDYVVLVRFVLLQDGADNGCQRQRNEQGDGQVHRTEEP